VTDDDRTVFDVTMRELVVAFRVRLSVSALKELSAVYFTALAATPLSDVVAAAQVCRDSLKKFPSIVDWLDAVKTSPTPRLAADVRWMHADEADALAQATARRYEDVPCGCVLCEAAGVTDRPLRFVPTERGEDDHERAFNPRTNRVEIVGHWAHGEELARWYLARDTFFGLARQAPRVLLDAVAVLVGEREPGMEG
jgi:hypothetical protein